MTQANNVAIESSQINSSGILQPAGGGTGVATATGTGSVVLSTSPTLVTPALGTPSSGTLTNCTFPTLNQNTTGTAAGLSATLAVASGGTGVTTSTGTGSVVLSTSPTLVTPILGTPTSGTLTNCTFPTLNQNTTGSAATFTSTSQNSQFNSVGVGTAGSTTAGEIRATNNITAYYSSDRQFKENVQDIQNATEIVAAIGGKTFDWTDAYLEAHGGEDGYFYQKSDFGVIAQDVQVVFPQAVRAREDGTLAVDYAKLSALAFAAITELTKRIEALENK